MDKETVGCFVVLFIVVGALIAFDRVPGFNITVKVACGAIVIGVLGFIALGVWAMFDNSNSK